MLVGVGAFTWILILILDGKTALVGAQAGVELCLKTVIPSLFPFFVLSTLLTGALSGTSFFLLRPLGKICGLGEGTETILISGFLGGYPVGAQAIARAYQLGQLQQKDAERMLAFCNNAGPAFLFGMVSSLFPTIHYAWGLWGIHILSAIMVAKLLPGDNQKTAIADFDGISVTQALTTSLRGMALVCGWVILFRVMIFFLQRWGLWYFPAEVQCTIIGLLELSNGCWALQSITDVKLRFLLCSGVLGFGGLCVTMQTAAVIGDLSLKHYLRGKGLQTVFSLLLSGITMYGSWQLGCIAAGLILFLSGKPEKRCSNPPLLGV